MVQVKSTVPKVYFHLFNLVGITLNLSIRYHFLNDQSTIIHLLSA